MGLLEGRTTVITGGAGGIGQAVAQRFYDEGANVVICDIRGEELSEAGAQISAHGGRVLAVEADVTLEADIHHVVEETLTAFGGVDVLVNVAGLLHFGRLDESAPSVWDQVMRVNAYAPWRFMVAVLPAMRSAGGGSIINISSINGIKAFPGAGLYCTSKAALQMLSQVMAMEVAADNIRVNLILPGTVEDTDFCVQEVGEEHLPAFFDMLRPLHPLGRSAVPQDVADAALFLASDQSRFITGVLLNVDGGRHMATNRPSAA